MKEKTSKGILASIIILGVAILFFFVSMLGIFLSTSAPALQAKNRKEVVTDTSDVEGDLQSDKTITANQTAGFSVTTGVSQVEETSSDFIFPNSDISMLTEDDLNSLTTKEEVQAAINEIYARCGRIFKDEKLQSLYEATDWYEGRVSAEEFDKNPKDYMNTIQYENVELLIKRRNEVSN